MQMLYHSDSFVVVRIDVPAEDAPGGGALARGGYEIVDRHARREIFIEGLLAERFRQGVQALVDSNPSEEAFDEFIGRWTALAQQPVTMH
jgi:hypothetical protein